MSTNLLKSDLLTNKRRLISQQEFELDMKPYLNRLGRVFMETKKEFNELIVKFPPQQRARGFETGTLNTMFIKCFQEEFPKNGKFGKYKRFIINLQGCILLFKKLNNKFMPMNISTRNVDRINNQTALNLFGESDYSSEPIIYLGYQKNQLGLISDLTFSYIDENTVKWTLSVNNFESGASPIISAITPKTPVVQPTLKKEYSDLKKTN